MCLSGAEAGIDHSAPAHAWHRFQAAPHQLLAAGQAFVPNQLVHQERTIADCSTTPLAAAVAAAAAAGHILLTYGCQDQLVGAIALGDAHMNPTDLPPRLSDPASQAH
jgi:hypothetical protein